MGSAVNSSLPSLSTEDEIKRELERKFIILQLIIKASDVSHPARCLYLHLEWSSRICEEFYCQGDLERSRGMKISPLCDRNVPATNYPQGQIGFINFISKPIFSLLSSICENVNESNKPWLGYMDSNVKYWENKMK